MLKKPFHCLLVTAIFGMLLTQPVLARGGGLADIIHTSHGKLSAQWWQYVTSFSAADDPRAEDGAIDCVRNQNGPLIFLAGTNGGTAMRSCTIPRNKSLFFPMANFLFDNAPGEKPASVDEKREILDGVLSDLVPGLFADFGAPGSRACGIFATLDGEPLSYSGSIVRTQSPPFSVVTGPDGNPPDANDPEAVSDGFWALVPPLTPGEHTLRFGGRLCEFDGVADHPFVAPVDVTYHLTVE